MRIAHVITGLGIGGAETAMARLVLATRDRVSHSVISLSGPGHWGRTLAGAGIPVHDLGSQRLRWNPVRWTRLLRTLRQEAPQVTQTWMYHSDLLGGISARLATSSRVVWGVRNLMLPRGASRASTRLVRRCCAWLSGAVPDRIVCNSQSTAEYHAALGYAGDKLIVIRNGIDTGQFRPDPESRARLRAEWKFDDHSFVIGMVARWDPMKDHATLIRALSHLKQADVPFRCVLAGPAMDAANRTLEALASGAGVADRLILAGQRDDVAAVMNAIDLHVLSSRSESFPNVVAEAMACGTRCVVTKTGDAPVIVGETGPVVATGDDGGLATAIRRCFEERNMPGLSRACRARIESEFGADAMAARYMRLWSELADAETP
jgi:glycosyltransferase involved in cell wall biosynthesis